jgi:quercetin dioxygenase-like cupin family protein
MHVFDLHEEQEFRPDKHVEKILATVSDGDTTVACWEPGQMSPNHCHPEATEIYLCLEGGGTMRTPTSTTAVTPGSFVVHPPGEVHEYINGEQRTLLFRVRYGPDRRSCHWNNRGKPGWVQSPEHAEYFRQHPVPDTYERVPSEAPA